MNARQWKRYPAYRDSGVEWLGEVPSHWEARRLKHVTEVLVSNVDKHAKEGEAEVRLCNYTDVYYNDRITPDLDFMVATASSSQIDKFTLRADDVLITKDSETAEDIAVPAVVTDDMPGVVCGYHLALLRPHKAKISGAFLNYMLRANPVSDQFTIGAQGITRHGLTYQKINDVNLYLPPLAEQRAIAAFLDRETARIDALIAKKEELIRLLEEKRASVVTQVVTRGLSPDAPTVDSGIPAIGAVPAHWRVVRNKNILRAVQDPSSDGSEELLTVSHITGVTPRTEKDVTMFLAESNVGYPRVAPGDLVINTMWAWMGALGVARHHGIVSPAYGVYRFTDAEVLPEYYDAFYRTPAYVTEMTRFSTGVWSSRLRIYPDVFLSLRVVVPPIDEQRAILDHIKAATGDTDAVLDRLAASVALLREQRQALITAAVTGQIDVREDALA